MRTRRSNRHRLGCLVLTCALVLALLAGCQTAPPVQEAGPVNVSCGISNAWDSLMPYNSVSGSNYARLIYDKIYDRLAYVQADGTCLPRGAVSWESAQEGYGIHFQLDPAAAFHDGTPVTAQHWADTFALVTDAACPTLGRKVFAGLAGVDETGVAIPGETLGVEAVDEYTLQLTFTDPVIPQEFLVDRNRDLYVLPTHLLEGVAPEDVMDLDLWAKPVGSGPCRFSSEILGSTLVLSANEAYPLGKPGFDTLTMLVMDKANLLTALLAGDLDYYAIGGSVTEEDAPMAEGAGFQVREGQVASTFYELMLNNESLDSSQLRRAVGLALDKQLLCQQSAGSLGMPASSSILPDSPYSSYDANGGDEAATRRDLEQARALLRQAGYQGETFTLVCTANRAGIAALIQQNLAEAGINVTIETVDSATMFSGMFDGIYDMAIASHTPNSLPLWFTQSRFNPDNNLFRVADLGGYRDRIAAIAAETQEEKRKELVADFEDYLAQESPFIPLWFAKSLHVESKTVTGIDYPAASFSNENVWQWVKQ